MSIALLPLASALTENVLLDDYYRPSVCLAVLLFVLALVIVLGGMLSPSNKLFPLFTGFVLCCFYPLAYLAHVALMWVNTSSEEEQAIERLRREMHGGVHLLLIDLGLAMLLFVVAVVGGGLTIWSAVMRRQKARQERRERLGLTPATYPAAREPTRPMPRPDPAAPPAEKNPFDFT